MPLTSSQQLDLRPAKIRVIEVMKAKIDRHIAGRGVAFSASLLAGFTDAELYTIRTFIDSFSFKEFE